MMNKTIGILMVIVFMGGLVIGGVMETKELALIAWDQAKIDRDTNLSKLNVDIIYTTDKICDVEERGIICQVCYKFIILDENYEACTNLPEGTDQITDQALVNEEVNAIVQEVYPTEYIAYIERLEAGNTDTITVEIREA